MVPVNKGNFGAALWPGINKWYGEAYAEFAVEYTSLFDTDSSSKAFEEDVAVVGLGLAAVKPDGQAVNFDGFEQSFRTRYQHVTYGLGFIITDEMIEDDQYMIVAKIRAKALAYSMRQTKERVAANVYNRAFNASYTGGDGVTMINSAHPNKSGGTWSNTLTTPADLSNASLEQAVIDIESFTDDRGLKINYMPKTLVLPVELRFEAERFLMSPLEPGNSNNDVNALKSQGLFRDVAINHYLTDSDAWFIRTTCPNGMRHFERRPDTFTDDNEFTTDNLLYKATARYSFGWTDPRGIYGSAGA